MRKENLEIATAIFIDTSKRREQEVLYTFVATKTSRGMRIQEQKQTFGKDIPSSTIIKSALAPLTTRSAHLHTGLIIDAHGSGTQMIWDDRENSVRSFGVDEIKEALDFFQQDNSLHIDVLQLISCQMGSWPMLYPLVDHVQYAIVSSNFAYGDSTHPYYTLFQTLQYSPRRAASIAMRAYIKAASSDSTINTLLIDVPKLRHTGYKFVKKHYPITFSRFGGCVNDICEELAPLVVEAAALTDKNGQGEAAEEDPDELSFNLVPIKEAIRNWPRLPQDKKEHVLKKFQDATIDKICYYYDKKTNTGKLLYKYDSWAGTNCVDGLTDNFSDRKAIVLRDH